MILQLITNIIILIINNHFIKIINLKINCRGYNDHLFHYGYFLYASAVVMHEANNDDYLWWLQIQDRVLALGIWIYNFI